MYAWEEGLGERPARACQPFWVLVPTLPFALQLSRCRGRLREAVPTFQLLRARVPSLEEGLPRPLVLDKPPWQAVLANTAAPQGGRQPRWPERLGGGRKAWLLFL